MTPKERVRRAVAFTEPDRVPHGEFAVDFEMVSRVLGRPSLYRGRFLEDQALAEGRWEELAEDYCVDYAEVVDYFGWDMLVLTLIPSRHGVYTAWQQTPDGLYTRGDGTYYARTPQNWMLLEHDERPKGDVLPAVDSIIYHEPELPDDSCFTAIDYLIERYAASHYLVLRLPVWHDYPHFGADYEEAMANLLTEEELIARWIEVHNAHEAAFTRKMLARYPQVDAVLLSVDYGFNSGPFVSPALFHRWIMPGIRQIADEAHNHGMTLIQHACGNNWALLDDFLAAGIDVYQSIQMSAGMDMQRLKAQYGDRLVLWGGASMESLISGTPDDVRREAHAALRHAAPGGGFIAGASHSIGVGVQYDNYMALIDTLRAYGEYPIRLSEGL